MPKLRNLKIAVKLAVPFAVLAIVAAISIWFSSNQLRDVDDTYSALVANEARATLLVSRANGRLYNLGRQSLALRLAEAPSEVKQIGAIVRGDLKAFENYLQEVTRKAPAFSSQADAVMKRYAAAFEIYLNAEKLILEGKEEAGKKLVADLNKESDEIRKLLYAMISGVEAAANKASDDATAKTNQTIASTVWGTAIAFGITIALAIVLVVSSITAPLTRLVAAMRELAQGNLSTQVPSVGRKDEVGLMADALLVFKENGLKARALEEDARLAREAAERARASNEAAREASAQEQKRVVDGLARGLSALAERDLTVHVSDFPGSYRQLERDFNAAVLALREAMSAVANNSGSILASSSEVSTAADSLARRTEQQAASLEETAAALDQVTATGKRAAESAGHARDVAAVAKADAQETGQVVRRTVDAMSNIEQSAQQITQIIGVIDEIAFQTNLLALNAGVEAARAGEAGRGFAVVASEVRALAQRSADAAKEIKALISTSSQQVAQGAELVSEAGSALERILKQVDDLNSVVADIASGAQEQATGLSQVNAAINQMDQATQQNAAMVEESTAASHSLSGEARELASLIAKFRLGEDDRGFGRRAA
jgi:methyl-accepting chemotaxis protein